MFDDSLLWKTPLPDMSYYEEMWKPKWYISLYWKTRYFLLHGEWPIRIWRCKDMMGPVDIETYQGIYQETIEGSFHV